MMGFAMRVGIEQEKRIQASEINYSLLNKLLEKCDNLKLNHDVIWEFIKILLDKN